jgi:transposase InsO family protein
MSDVASTSHVSEVNDDSPFFYPWYADSATTSHITHERSAYIDYKPITPKPIYGLGKSFIWAYGQGTVEVLSFVRGKLKLFYLKETLFTPNHPDNLLSIGRIDANGGKIIFGDHKAVLFDNKNNVIVEGKLSTNRLYPLDIYRRTHSNAETSKITTETHQHTWDEWHHKYGHVSATGLKRLLADKLVDRFEVDETLMMGDCDACIQAKQSHVPFPKKAKSRSKEPGELTHTDVWGPARTTSWSGMRYNITFIDNSTRHCTCEQMKNKHETSAKLQQYLVLIERQYGYIPKRVRIDQGREYLTNKFRTWCADQGIIIETTAPYSPLQNGVAERMNRTLTELARAMIIARNIPKSIWPEAVNHGTYIHNRSYM